MRLRNLDRRVTLVRQQTTENAAWFGDSDTTRYELWASVKQKSVSTKYQQGVEVGLVQAAFYIRAEDLPAGFAPKDFNIEYNEQTYDITSVAESWERGRTYELGGELRQ